MSLTQELDDECEEIGSKIILKSDQLEEESSPFKSKTSTDKPFNSPQTFLRVGKPGKLFLKPNYTAFTKTNLGSIPSKVEKTLIKTEESIPITVTLNKNFQKINLMENTERNYSTSYSSRGYGVGFVSKVPRFDYGKRIVYPGPGDYSPEKNDSVQNNVNKSIFGKSLFNEKSIKSLRLLNTNKDKFYTSQEILSLLRKNYNQRYLNKNGNNNNIDNNNTPKNENNKGNYYFESKVKKFTGGIFNVYNKNPGPGKYFIDTEFKIKNKEKKSPDFIEPLTKIEDPLKTFGINKNNEKKGFYFIGSNRGGKLTNFLNGSPFMGYSYDFGKTLKNIKDNKNIKDLKKNKIISLPDTNMSNNLRTLGRLKNKFALNDYLSNNNNNSKENLNLENHFFNNIYDKTGMRSDLIKYKKKDYFSLSSPRWEEGNFHDNASHFQIPGPAYYQPRDQLLKRSFNLNKKDFIYTNSLPFLEKKYTDY